MVEACERLAEMGAAKKLNGGGYQLFTNLPPEVSEKIAQNWANRCSEEFSKLDEAAKIKKKEWRQKNKLPFRVQLATTS